MTEKNRINKNPRTGTGDKGFSQVLYDLARNKSKKVKKSNPILLLQNRLELFRNSIALYLLDYPESHQVKDRAILNRLVTTEINNLCGQVYFELESTKLLVPKDFFSLVETRIQDITTELESQKEFITSSSKRYILLDNIRVYVREIEHLFWVMIHNFSDQEYNKVITTTMSFVNMLSDYFMQLNRLETVLQNEDVVYWETENE